MPFLVNSHIFFCKNVTIVSFFSYLYKKLSFFISYLDNFDNNVYIFYLDIMPL
jgi:hypothetical protein